MKTTFTETMAKRFTVANGVHRGHAHAPRPGRTYSLLCSLRDLLFKPLPVSLLAAALLLFHPLPGYAAPDLVGQWPGLPRGNAWGVAVSGHYAYMAARDGGGLQVIDVSNPANPQHVGGYDTGGEAFGVAVSGSYAYVADGPEGLQVIDVSNPASPQRVGGYDTSGFGQGVAVSGNYAYLADGDWGLLIFGPRMPRITSITRAAGTATVYYTNTIPGVNYMLQYRTNFNTGSWLPVGARPAPGLSAFQTDNAVSGDQRYYRVYYFYQP